MARRRLCYDDLYRRFKRDPEFNLVFGITYGLKVFDIIYVLTNGGPGHATEVLTTYSFQLYSTGQYGMSTAMNTVLLIITAIIGVGVVKMMSRQEG